MRVFAIVPGGLKAAIDYHVNTFIWVLDTRNERHLLCQCQSLELIEDLRIRIRDLIFVHLFWIVLTDVLGTVSCHTRALFMYDHQSIRANFKLGTSVSRKNAPTVRARTPEARRGRPVKQKHNRRHHGTRLHSACSKKRPVWSQPLCEGKSDSYTTHLHIIKPQST
jgi:hypothetical protein